MILKSGTIIPFIFKDAKKLIAITSSNENAECRLQFKDVENAIYLAFANLKNKCEFYNPNIEFQIPEELLIPYLEQHQDLNNFVVKIVETDEIRDEPCKKQEPSMDPQKSIVSVKRCLDIDNVTANQIKKFKLDSTDPHLTEILKTSPKGQEIMKNFESTNVLCEADSFALIKLLISFEFKDLVKNKAPIALSTERLEHLSYAIACQFPGEDPSEYFVEHSKSFKFIAGGKLYEEFLEKKMQYIKQMEAQKRYLYSTDDEIIEIDFPETRDLLEVTADWPLFLSTWKYTFDLRMAYFRNSLNPMAYFENLEFDYEKTNNLVDYDFERLYPNISKNLFDNWDKLSERILTKAHVLGYEDVSFIIDSYGHLSELTGLMILSYFVKNFDNGTKHFEKTDITNLVIHIESLTGDPEEIIREYYADNISTESLMVFATGKCPEEHKFYVLVGSQVFLMESALKAIDFCFRCYQVLHLYYPDEQSISWQIIQNTFYDLKCAKNYSRSQKLLEDLLNCLNKI